MQFYRTYQKCGESEKKWTSYMSEKKKAAKQRRELRQTGGGPPPCDLTPLEETVVGIIGDTPIDGIPGGIDIAEDTEERPTPEFEAESPGPSQVTDSRRSCQGKCGSGADPGNISKESPNCLGISNIFPGEGSNVFLSINTHM
jgi:hypothetical protein